MIFDNVAFLLEVGSQFSVVDLLGQGDGLLDVLVGGFVLVLAAVGLAAQVIEGGFVAGYGRFLPFDLFSESDVYFVYGRIQLITI